jgi:cytidylate kinase
LQSPAIPLSIAIDGPAAAGKSTTAREVARRLGLLYVDSGAMYRALAWKLLDRKVDPADSAALEHLLASTTIDLADRGGETQVILDGEEITERLRDERVGSFASTIAPLKMVRAYLVDRQREVARNRGVVMEGRDIGTVVLPEAAVKIFLIASLDVRAERRQRELLARGRPADLAEIRRLIAERDRRDLERAESPLRPAPDAVEVDTTSLGVEEQVEQVLDVVRRRSGELGEERSPNTGSGGGGTDITGFYWFIRSLARAIARVLFRLRIEGLHHLPRQGGFILAANHASLLDPPLMGLCATRRLGYLAKEELFTIPGLKQLIEAMGAIPIHRSGPDRLGIEAAKSVLTRGCGLLLFPEGTRTRSGALGPARPGVSMLAAESGVVVIPAHIQGTWRLGSAIFRRPRVVVRFGPALSPPATGSGRAWRDELRAHAGRIMQAIAGLGNAGTDPARTVPPRMRAPAALRRLSS